MLRLVYEWVMGFAIRQIEEDLNIPIVFGDNIICVVMMLEFRNTAWGSWEEWY